MEYSNISSFHEAFQSPCIELDHVRDKTIESLGHILELKAQDWFLYFELDTKKVWVIDYSIESLRDQCYIAFFGTKNGKNSSRDYPILNSLDNMNEEVSWLSYLILEKFIYDICYPNGIKKIYLDPDSDSNKYFWRYKLGAYFLEKWFFKKIYSSGFGLCFELSDKK